MAERWGSSLMGAHLGDPTDTPEESIGCPISVQLIGRRLNEEYLLGVTRRVDEAVKASRGKL